MGTRQVVITAEATSSDYTEQFARFLTKEQRNPRTLQSYRDEFGGSLEGDIEDPFGSVQRISLAAFSDLNPDIYIKIQFITPPEGKLPSPLSEGAVILGEYWMSEI